MPLLSFTRALAAAIAFSLPALGFAPGLTASAHAQSGQNDLAAVNKAIRSITTFKAAFTQTDAKGQIQTGTILLKQPGHVRFNYAGGDLLIVADGKSLYMIDYEVAQVQRLPIRNSPIGALLDPSRDLTRYGKLVPSGRDDVVSVEARDSAHPEYGTITLVFARKASAPGGFELSGWVMKDAQGNRTTISLSGISYGAAIADSAFAWRDPRPNRVGPRH
ncbi:MAG: outer membrane lipoprotein carrier protein LolA [Sphingobium sp.]|nr:outer membrane lipoprotein carrier protein LolA [Sphingobium sp.]